MEGRTSLAEAVSVILLGEEHGVQGENTNTAKRRVRDVVASQGLPLGANPVIGMG